MAEEGSHYQTRGDIRGGGGGGYGDALAGAFTLMHDSREDVKDEERNAIAIAEEKRRYDHDAMMQQRQENLAKWQQDKLLQQQSREMDTKEMDARRQDRADKVMQNHMKIQDQRESDAADSAGIAATIHSLDATRPDYPAKMKEIISDPDTIRLSADKKTAGAILMAQKEQNQTHKNMATWLQQEAHRNGYQGSIYDLPTTKDGEWDLDPDGKIYGEAFPESRKSAAAFAAQKEQEKESNAAGMTTAKDEASQAVKEGSPEYFTKQFKDTYGMAPGVLDIPIGTKNPKGYSVTQNGDMVQVTSVASGKLVSHEPIPIKDWLTLSHNKKVLEQPKTDRPPSSNFGF